MIPPWTWPHDKCYQSLPFGLLETRKRRRRRREGGSHTSLLLLFLLLLLLLLLPLLLLSHLPLLVARRAKRVRARAQADQRGVSDKGTGTQCHLKTETTWFLAQDGCYTMIDQLRESFPDMAYLPEGTGGAVVVGGGGYAARPRGHAARRHAAPHGASTIILPPRAPRADGGGVPRFTKPSLFLTYTTVLPCQHLAWPVYPLGTCNFTTALSAAPLPWRGAAHQLCTLPLMCTSPSPLLHLSRHSVVS
jgi:hypothetical protein